MAFGAGKHGRAGRRLTRWPFVLAAVALVVAVTGGSWLLFDNQGADDASLDSFATAAGPLKLPPIDNSYEPKPQPVQRKGQPARGRGRQRSTTKRKPRKPGDPIMLFDTVDFRGQLKKVPKWDRVLKAEQKNPTFGTSEDKTMPERTRKNWQELREKIKNDDAMEQAKAVNAFFNKWPYRTDKELWGIEDYWATPAEFIKKSGDCEDYAIIKYYALRSLGVPADKMRIVALNDTIRGIGHAVLAFYYNDDAYILDNVSGLILPHMNITHYDPVYSVNEQYRWVHVKPLN